MADVGVSGFRLDRVDARFRFQVPDILLPEGSLPIIREVFPWTAWIVEDTASGWSTSLW
jgi:hypothetical protein